MRQGGRLNFRPKSRFAVGGATILRVFSALLVVAGMGAGFVGSQGVQNQPEANRIPAGIAYFPESEVRGEQKNGNYEFEQKLSVIPGVQVSDRRALSRELALVVESDRFFEIGTATLRPDASESLRQIADAARETLGQFALEIEGHTDDSPIRRQKKIFSSNWELSVARATSFVRVFEAAGIPKSFLKVAGFGDSRPRVPNREGVGLLVPDHQAKNRRIVLRFQTTRNEEAGRN